jgi:hypothetical protein
MALSPDEAAQALSEIEAAETRSRMAYGYLIGGSYLILWGVIWVVCYSLVDFRPDAVSIIWLAGCAVGVAGSVILGRRRGESQERRGWRAFVPATGYVVFAFLLLNILRPRSVEDSSIAVALIVSLAYVQIGVHLGDRLMLIGAGLAALSLAGYVWIPLHFHLYMAFVGGGSMILAGFWLRRV